MFTYKVVLVGDFGVGKTSLIKRYVDNSFSEDYISSIGVSISKKELATLKNNKEINSTMMIWDIEGRTDYKPIFTPYLSGSKGFVIVADLTRSKTIDSIKEHIKTCEGMSGNLPLCIALNKSDLCKEEVDLEQIKSLSENIVCIKKTSAKDSSGVMEIFNSLNNRIVEGIS